MSGALNTRPSKRQRISYSEGEDDDTASPPAKNIQHGDITGMTKAEPAHTESNGRRTRGWADLPGELRNQIYELCLAPSPFPIAVRSVEDTENKSKLQWTSAPTYPRNKHLRPTVNLLLINKATYAECNTYLYLNHFYFFTSMDLSLFLKCLSVAQKLMLRNLTLLLPRPFAAITMGCGLTLREHSNFLLSGLKELEGATNLERLQLSSVDSMWSSKWLAVEIHKKARRWLEEISAKKGSNEKAAELIDVNAIHSPGHLFGDKDWQLAFLTRERYRMLSSSDTSILREELVKRMR
ncbi:hypothetical protein DIS24_g8974 [Lasiodiplodia hormozganensis]|uniref:Uncharacterized protein n=1 Tax=Lasiodiplodia hormozganensis TaxID=869390 RepID=A0AA39XY71_9PEZI|nr:hypothetical protein DIS24_g8974 [Lasiodiplodia hormozganensis]